MSTRGGCPEVDFETAMREGLAPDGGLYIPAAWPVLDDATLRRLEGASYVEIAEAVMAPFMPGFLEGPALRRLLEDAYATFSHRAVTPLVQLEGPLWLLELFHGPTLAFKDVAMQALARLFETSLRRSGGRALVVGATSGDTGSAAIAALRGREGIDVVILHPKGRVSDIQRRQMTCVQDANIHNIAIEGTFDDAQGIVKQLFADEQLRRHYNLTAVNSINWARIMAQSVYFVAAGLALGARQRDVTFVVPTGNFGDAYSARVAKSMGIKIARIVIATNENDILVRALETGRYLPHSIIATTSPSMDIAVASNFERLLFETHGRDGRAVEMMMSALRTDQVFEIARPALDEIRADFDAFRATQGEVAAEIAALYAGSNILIDPHTGVALHVARTMPHRGEPVIVLATAGPAKFPDAVLSAAGVHPELPARIAKMTQGEERLTVLPADMRAVRDYIETKGIPAA